METKAKEKIHAADSVSSISRRVLKIDFSLGPGLGSSVPTSLASAVTTRARIPTSLLFSLSRREERTLAYVSSLMRSEMSVNT